MSSAREKAIGYLARFARSERQVRNYLVRKEFSSEEIAEAITYLRDRGFLNDASFAESVVRERIRRCDGPRKIRQMLFEKGIDSETQDRLLRELYPEELQVEAAAELIRKRLRRTSDRDKVLRFVASRGFSRYVMIQALKNCTEVKES